jgi:hypothetical protein
MIVSTTGGLQLIADLNAYHAFVTTLRQSQVTAYFTSLKMVGEIYLVEDPKDLGALVRDAGRYEGTLSPDDLYELGAFLLSAFLSSSRFPSITALRGERRQTVMVDYAVADGADLPPRNSSTTSRLEEDRADSREAALRPQARRRLYRVLIRVAEGL